MTGIQGRERLSLVRVEGLNMLRQYSPQRHRLATIGGISRAVGTMPIGTIFFYRKDRRHETGVKCILRAWHTRSIPTELARGVWVDRRCARFGHLATVETLANGRQFQLADHIIRRALDDE